MFPRQQAASHGSSAPVTVSLVAMRILVAEDSEFNAQLMEKLLGKTRPHGSSRERWPGALALAKAGDFDLLLLDVHMPEMDGFQVIGSIREQERTSGLHLP